MFNRILVANDGSEGAARAFSAEIKLAKIHDAELHMICVEEMPRFPSSIAEVVEEQLEANHLYEAVNRRALVVRFRHLHPLAAGGRANAGIKGPLATI